MNYSPEERQAAYIASRGLQKITMKHAGECLCGICRTWTILFSIGTNRKEEDLISNLPPKAMEVIRR